MIYSNGHPPISQVSDVRLPNGPSTEHRPLCVLTHPYWSRVWIIQEFASNGAVEVLTETRTITISQLDRMLRDADVENREISLDRVNAVMKVRKRCRDNKWPSLLDMLLRTSTSSSKDRHDRVFGVLSMARDRRKFLVNPRYDETEEALSLRMTNRYLKDSGDSHLDLVLLGGHFARTRAQTNDFEQPEEEGFLGGIHHSVQPNGARQRIKLPSWCPNYFRFDNLPPDRRLFEYVRDLFDRTHAGEAGAHRPLFRAANGSICTPRRIGDKVLRTPCHYLGSVESLGWIASDESMASFPTTNTSDNIWTNDDDIAAALWNLLATICRRDLLEANIPRNDEAAGKTTARARLELATAEDPQTKHDYKTCTYPYVYFMLRVFDGSSIDIEAAGDAKAWYGQWLIANQHFVFGQRNLLDHAKTMRPALRSSRFWKWAEPTRHALLASTHHSELRDWKRMHQPIKTVAEQQMRMMTLNMGHQGVIGLAHESARRGDQVFLLSGCSVPVILRRGAEGRYIVIGDAIVPGAMFGEKWEVDSEEIELI